MDNLDTYLDQFTGLLVTFAPKALLAIITLVIGLWVIKKIVGLVEKALLKKEVDISLRNFLGSFIGILLKVLLIISVIQMVGVETTSFVAILAAAGFAIGMALQGSLGNFAGGILILVFKPFKVGDVIEAQGFIGKVESILVFNTILITPDNRKIIIPNGGLSSGAITNITALPTRRVDMTFGIGYEDDIARARNIIKEIIDNNDKILKDPESDILVSELADSSVNFAVRVWCETSEYWNVYFDMQEMVKLEFDKQSISIPYPQRDIHVFNQ